MDDIPWIYVAMIFIAFISWLRGRIQEASATRRQRALDRKAKQRERRTTEPAYESPYSARREKAAARNDKEPETFRDIFREIERQIKTADEDPELAPELESSGPPPLPPTSTQPQESPEPVTSTPLATEVRRARRKPSKNPSQTGSLASILGNQNHLRTALILSEVLDKPRALQQHRPRQS
ncbi:MAG: hypothetical protein CMO61_03035 [Verrucomicrobiales bacterium]|jgi:hypothetical protein|nr:hypothetical protein [Verrucomicrobiales bacterium]|tara:strand:+ start:32614 stop:33156 length:543 start_codon:yes stop_codon:yes gene_type:complete